MALKNCKECGKEISTQANSCPHCGALLKNKMGCLGYFLLGVGVLFVLGYIGSLSKQESPTSPSPSLISPPSRQAAQQKTYKTGETVHIGYMSYAIWRSWWSQRLSDNEFLDQRPDSLFLFVNLTASNDDSKARTIPPFKLIDEKGAEYETTSKAWAVEGAIGILHDLNPGVSTQGTIVFDVPMGHQYKLKLSGGYWSSDNALVALSEQNVQEKKQQDSLQSKQSEASTPVVQEPIPPAGPSTPSQVQQTHSPNEARNLNSIYSGPMADFLIPADDIKKNETLFPLSGCFEVELHSKYKGPARDGMIQEVNKMIVGGKMMRGAGNPTLLSDIVSNARFDTRKKTVNFAGKQSYVDTDNAIIGTREIQETYDLSSPKYSTLSKVCSGIESLLAPGEKVVPKETSRPSRPTPAQIIEKLKNP